MKKQLMLLMLFILFSPTGVTAKNASNVEKTIVRSNFVIEKIEQYLNSIKTLQADFVQIDKNGNSTGKIFLKKSTKSMIMDYAFSHVIIAKKRKIIYYNRELKEKTETSMHSSPLAFLMNEKINLKNNLIITSFREIENFLFIKLCKKDPELNGAITIVFTKNPMTIVGWMIFEDKNDESPEKTIEITLTNPKINEPVSDKVFQILD